MSRDSSHRLGMSVTSPSSHLPVDHGPIEQVARQPPHGEGALHDPRLDHRPAGRYTMNAPASITITPVQVADLLAEGELMPVYVHVINHPDGRVLVDTGMTELHPLVADMDPASGRGASRTSISPASTWSSTSICT